jgi:hypothetical protein
VDSLIEQDLVRLRRCRPVCQFADNPGLDPLCIPQVDGVFERRRIQDRDIEFENRTGIDGLGTGEADHRSRSELVADQFPGVDSILIADRAARIGCGDQLSASQHFLVQHADALAGAAEALDRVGTGRIHAECVAGFANHDHTAPGGRVAPPLASSQRQRLVRHDPGLMLICDCLVLVHHPRHRLWVRVHIGGGNVALDSDVLPERAHVCPGRILEFPGGHLPRVADNGSLSAAQREINHCGLPRHPPRLGPNRIHGFVRVKPDPPFRRAACKIVLNAIPVKDARLSVVHLNREGELELALRPEQQVQGSLVQI